MKLRETSKPGASVAIPAGSVAVSLDGDACVTPTIVLKAQLPLSPGGELLHWPMRPGWRSLDLLRSKATFDNFNWFRAALEIPSHVQAWATIQSSKADFTPDPRCAPARPSLKWHKMGKVGSKLGRISSRRLLLSRP